MVITRKKNPTIALIDDHVIVRKGLRNLVESFDEFDVVFDVENFEELVVKLKTNKNLDLLLMDIKMPNKNGFEVALWMREHYPLIKVLALSSEEDGFSIAKVMRNGAKGFVGKSANPTELLLGIHTVLRGDSYLSQESFNMFSNVIQNSQDYFANNKVEFTEKELEFIKWACTGLSYKEMAVKMFIGAKAVDFYRITVFNKIAIHTRQELAVYAVQNNLLH